jgi:sulfide dehydrogenase [flavocytochrome c] flavoprotein subunit
MKDGGVVTIVAPPNPFRCPPGPYERASQIAMYLQAKKPKSKVVILDPKPKFSKMGLFTQAWRKLYGYDTANSMIDWRGTPKGSDDNVVSQVDVASRTVTTGFDELKSDVLNIIPPQKAGKIAFAAGLTNDSGWCPINLKTFESTLHAGIHVIGDASIAKGMPKSGYAANSEAKVCAAAVVAMLNGQEPGVPAYVNTCYSIAGKDYGFSVAAVYQLAQDGSKITKVSGGLTPSDATPEQLKREVAYAYSWLANITDDSFGG